MCDKVINLSVLKHTLPNGRQSLHQVDVPITFFAECLAIQKLGITYTMEQLTTGEWSLALEGEKEDLDIEILPPTDDPDLVFGFTQLLKRYKCLEV